MLLPAHFNFPRCTFYKSAAICQFACPFRNLICINLFINVVRESQSGGSHAELHLCVLRIVWPG